MKEPNNFEKYVTAKPNATNLKAMALQQQNQIESQHQLLSAKEQRLRYLKVHEINITTHDHENEHLQRLRERVEAQESKLRRLRALRGQVDLQKTYNVSIGNDLDSIRALFSEKEKELSLAVAKVEALTKQLEELRRDRREPYSLLTSNTNGIMNHHELSSNPSTWATKELEKLRKELLHRNQLSLQQDAKLNLQREALQLRQAELRSVDQRIFELQTRLQKKKASNLILQRNHKHQLTNTNYSEIINNFSGPVKLSNNVNSTQRMILRGNVAAIEPYVHNPEKAIVTPTNIQLNKKKQTQILQGQSNNDNYNNNRIVNGTIHNNTRSECDENKLARQKLYPGYEMLIPDETNKLNGYYSGNHYNGGGGGVGGGGGGHHRITCDDSIILNSNKDKYKTIPSIINYATKVNYKLTKSVSSGAIPHHIYAAEQDGNTHTTNNSNEKENSNKNGYAYDDNDTDDDDDNDTDEDDDDQNDDDHNNDVEHNNNAYEHSKVDNRNRQDGNNNNIVDVVDHDAKNRNAADLDGNIIKNDDVKKKDILANFTNNETTHRRIDNEQQIKYKEQQELSSGTATTNQSLKYNTAGHKQLSSIARSNNTTSNGILTAAATNQKNDKSILTSSKGLIKSFSISSGNSVVPPRKPISSVAPTTVSKFAHSSKVNLVSPSVNASTSSSTVALTAMVTVTTASVSTTSSVLPPPLQSNDILKPCLPPKPNKQPLLEMDTKNNTTNNSCIPTIVNVINKPITTEIVSLPPPISIDTDRDENSQSSSPIVDNLPIKARPLTIKKQPLSEQPRLRSISSGIKPIQYSSRRIEIPPAFLFPKVNETTYNDDDDDDDNNGGVAEVESVEGTNQPQIPSIINKENTTDDIPNVMMITDNNAGKLPATEKSVSAIIRRNRTSIINYEHTKTNLTRRVSFDPLALLLDASLEGELELVKKTTMQVPNPSAANDEGITALHNSICAGHFEIVKYLVEYGCDVNAQDSDGWTPLHCAASCNNLAMVKFLVETGACLFATTLSDQETPAEKCEEDEEGFDGCSEYLYSVQEKLGILNRGEVYAVFSYDSQQSDELSFEVNEQLIIVRKGDEAEREWWWAQSLSGKKEGYVPRNLLGLYPRIPLQSSTFND